MTILKLQNELAANMPANYSYSISNNNELKINHLIILKDGKNIPPIDYYPFHLALSDCLIELVNYFKILKNNTTLLTDTYFKCLDEDLDNISIRKKDNKCNSFLTEINADSIRVIPSKFSKITEDNISINKNKDQPFMGGC